MTIQNRPLEPKENIVKLHFFCLVSYFPLDCLFFYFILFDFDFLFT